VRGVTEKKSLGKNENALDLRVRQNLKSNNLLVWLSRGGHNEKRKSKWIGNKLF